VKTLRIFISSPGDVAAERDKAKQVIAALQRHYDGQVTLVPVLWEELAIPATASFQEGIDCVVAEQHRIDIAVFILWSRLGTPLGGAISKPDGSSYRSGTEREFDLMLAAFEQSERKFPLILAYTRDDSEGFNDRLDARTHGEDALEELLRQRKLVKQFIRERFHDAEGRSLRAYHTYREPVSFAQRLHAHLRQAVDELLGLDQPAATWTEAPYRSLEVFDIRHAPIFCGRDEETCDLLQRLRDQERAGCAFACIVGASGSGKSSLARARVQRPARRADRRSKRDEPLAILNPRTMRESLLRSKPPRSAPHPSGRRTVKWALHNRSSTRVYGLCRRPGESALFLRLSMRSVTRLISRPSPPNFSSLSL